jgi:hypothetical protein
MFKKLWKEITRVRELKIELVSYETEEEENARIAEALAVQVQKIKCENYLSLMERLKDFAIDEELSKTGLLITPIEAFNRAHELFCQAKEHGKIDEFNRIVSEVECEKY